MTTTGGAAGRPWWQGAVFYQLYPRSFHDSNGDGIGDLQGIISRLDYLNDGADRGLGIDAIWLSPTFPSSMVDFGYDVRDYCDVDPVFGALEDMDRLIDECHRRGIRVLLDFVPNHTSNQHPWFLASRSSRDNPRRGWYCWHDRKRDGSPPNNWLSAFGGSVWEWDGQTEQYYLHSFLKQQPDLNWHNPEVVAAMHDVLRFWLRRGIDGFRIDALGMLLKDARLGDNPANPAYHPEPGTPEHWQQLWIYNRNRPEVYDAVRAIRRVVDEFPDRLVVGEVFGAPQTLARFHGGAALDGLQLAFNFQLIGGYDEPYTPWDASVFRRVVDAAEAALPAGAWPAYLLGNHDQPRLVSRLGGGRAGQARARAAAVLLLTLRCTPFIYYGDEIGMEDVPISPEQALDPARFDSRNRDVERTPMQWSRGPGAGFSAGKPWLPPGDLTINVQDQYADPDSLLNLYRGLAALRRRTPALRVGSYRPLVSAATGVFAFLREGEGECYLCAVNFRDTPGSVRLPAEASCGEIVCSSKPGRTDQEVRDALSLGPDEGCVVRLRTCAPALP